MANILNILILPTYSTLTLAVVDISVYDPTTPSDTPAPALEIDVPGFGIASPAFVMEETNIYNSTDLGITTAGNETSIPDGIYCFKYTKDVFVDTSVEKSIVRVDKLQERFDEAFMRLDMMECERAIKTQAKVTLNTIYFFIQGAIAAANNCATIESQKLYMQADVMLDTFIGSNCGCSGNNYLVNFH